MAYSSLNLEINKYTVPLTKLWVYCNSQLAVYIVVISVHSCESSVVLPTFHSKPTTWRKQSAINSFHQQCTRDNGNILKINVYAK